MRSMGEMSAQPTESGERLSPMRSMGEMSAQPTEGAVPDALASLYFTARRLASRSRASCEASAFDSAGAVGGAALGAGC